MAAASLPVGRIRRAFAQTPAPRFLIVVEGNGFEPASVLCDSARAALDQIMSDPVATSRWWYRRYRHESVMDVSSPDLGQSQFLRNQMNTEFPLEPLAERGLIEKSTVLLGLSSRITGGGHSAKHGALASARTLGGKPGGQTIDAYLASLPQVRRITPFDAIRFGAAKEESIDFGTCAYAAGRPAPIIRKLSQAYAFAYGAFTEGDARLAFERRERMLRFATDDLNAAKESLVLPESELAKLDSYGASLSSLLETQGRLQGMRVEPPSEPTGGDHLARFDQLVQLATSALIDGLTSVAVVGSATGGNFGVTYRSVSETARHDMQHGSGKSAELLQDIRQVNRVQVSAIADAAKRLDNAGLLGSTVVLWVGDNGEQHHSTASEFPVLLIGGQDLGLRPGGRTLIYPGVNDTGNRQLSNLWNTLGHLAGQPLDDFGAEVGSLRRATGPLSELMG